MITQQTETKEKLEDTHQEKSTVVAGADDEYQRKIAEAAYYKAESRGFAPSHEMDDWIEAEKEIRGNTDKL